MPVRALGGDANRDARRLFEQLANPAAEHLIGVGRPLALMQNLKPGFDREGLDEASAVGDVLINSPRIGAVALSRISKLVDRAQELGPVVGVDAYSTTATTGPWLFSTLRATMGARQCMAGEKSIPTPV